MREQGSSKAERITELAQNESWEACAEMCMQSIAKESDIDWREWYTARVTLAIATRGLSGQDRCKGIEIAIWGIEEILARQSLDADDVRMGENYRALAYLYSKRASGGSDENRMRSIEYYTRAMEILRADRVPEEWAGLALARAALLLDKVRDMTAEDIRDRAVRSNASQSMLDAIRMIEEAREIYEREGMADELRTAHELVDSARNMKAAPEGKKLQ